VTPGIKTPEVHRREADAYFDPVDLNGCSVIDIGAWNGFYSFEAKKRGAKRVLAVDHFVWMHPTFRGRETFDLVRSTLGLDVEALEIDIPELRPEQVGIFDVVLFLGIFYHLFDPVDGLARAAKLARELLIVETHIDLRDLDRPAMVFYPGRELADDPTNWWSPNPDCMIGLLNNLGFVKIDAAYHPFGAGRAVFHAWRSEARRRSGPPPELVISRDKPLTWRHRAQKMRIGMRMIRDAWTF
jgi:tRNA (mo5U34)-methyltransferase